MMYFQSDMVDYIILKYIHICLKQLNFCMKLKKGKKDKVAKGFVLVASAKLVTSFLFRA